MGYLGHFIVYFLAMIGIIILALFVYKKFNMNTLTTSRRNNLKIEDYLSLSPRKTLYVIREGNERFLISSDTDRTSLISKLEPRDEEITALPRRRRIGGVDLSEEVIQAQNNVSPINKPVMKEIKSKLNF